MGGVVDDFWRSWSGSFAGNVSTHGLVFGLVGFLYLTRRTVLGNSIDSTVIICSTTHACNIYSKYTSFLPIPEHSTSIQSQMGRRDVLACVSTMQSCLGRYENALGLWALGWSMWTATSSGQVRRVCFPISLTGYVKYPSGNWKRRRCKCTTKSRFIHSFMCEMYGKRITSSYWGIIGVGISYLPSTLWINEYILTSKVTDFLFSPSGGGLGGPMDNFQRLLWWYWNFLVHYRLRKEIKLRTVLS